jgi:hypothetical protein
MKIVQGTYYKNTETGKKKESFQLKLCNESDRLGDLRKLAIPILRQKDPEFVGIRELYLSDAEDIVTPDVPSSQLIFSSEQHIRRVGKQFKIKSYHNKKIKDLIKEIEDAVEEGEIKESDIV